MSTAGKQAGKKIYTVDLGGRPPRQLIQILQGAHVSDLVDVGGCPHYALSKRDALARSGIKYHNHPELGNVFHHLAVSSASAYYRMLLAGSGPLLVERLLGLIGQRKAVCLFSAEREWSLWHAKEISEYLEKNYGVTARHL